MAYQIIARKWRPQSFADLVGQSTVSQTLLNALRSGRLPQALLFTGVRGTGKTSSARILAKSLRCTNATDFVPCGVCSQCEDIANSRAIDVIEIDGASNNGVDAIRELRETVGYMPSSGRYKIYIIDEVHMLSTSAFNALLKTLEEPPPHVIFIMATTEAQKIPNTILSRCQRFDFRRIPSREIAELLKKICDAENVHTESEALWLIARQADGSMRDSQSLLDQVITFSASDVTLEKTVSVLGLTDRGLLLETLQALIARDVQATVGVVERIFRAGYDAKNFAQDLLEEIRNALFVRLLAAQVPGRATEKAPGKTTDTTTSAVVDLPDVEIQALRQMTSALSEEDLHLLFDMCLKGVNDIMRSQDARIVLEMLLLRMAAAPRIASLAQLMSGHSALAAPTTKATISLPAKASAASLNEAASRAAPKSSAVSTASAITSDSQPVAMSNAPSAAPPAAPPQPPSRAPAAGPAAPSDDRKFTAASFTRPASESAARKLAARAQALAQAGASTPATQSVSTSSRSHTDHDDTHDDSDSDDAPVNPLSATDPWLRFVEKVKRSNSLLGAMLENTHLAEQTQTQITIGVPKKVGFLIDKVRDPDNLKRIENFIEVFWGKKLNVEVKLQDVMNESATPKARSDEHKAVQKRAIEKAVEDHPLVKTAQNVFKSQIKAIQDSAAAQAAAQATGPLSKQQNSEKSKREDV